MAEPVFNREEVQVLRQARILREFIESEGWREYEKILKAQIETRQLVITTPLSERLPAFEGMDFTTRAVAVEVVKGALIGLNLALSIPQSTIAHGKEIMQEHEGADDASRE